MTMPSLCRPRALFVVLALVVQGGVACQSSPTGPSPRASSGDPPASTNTASPTAGSIALTDDDVTAAVLREIAADAAIRDYGIRVQTKDGIVDITGTTDNVLAKELATRHAEVVKGVRSVVNRIVVVPPRVGDAELSRSITQALQTDPAAEVKDLRVEAKDGAVTLGGTVSSFEQKLYAARVAKGTRGTADVIDRLSIDWKTDRTDAEIAADVRRRLRWDVLVDHALVRVDVDGGKVRLSGTVGSAAERSRATRDAWVLGVSDVDAAAVEVKGWARDPHLRAQKYVIEGDDEVAAALRDALGYDPRVDAATVQATVSGGVATLRGTVATLAARNAAEKTAMHTVGVHSVNNHLVVRSPRPLADRTLAARVKSALDANPFTDAHEVAAQIRDGKLVLSGTVDSYFEKREAEAVAASVPGVRAIENRLVVAKPRPPHVYDPYVDPFLPPPAGRDVVPAAPTKADATLARDIETELFWSPFVDGEDVQVRVDNGHAMLSGTVESWREKMVAAEEALQAGAVVVENRIAVR